MPDHDQLENLTIHDVWETAELIGEDVPAESRNYYETMDRIYEAARTLAVFTPKDLEAEAERRGIDQFCRTNGLTLRQGFSYYGAVKNLRPGSKDWAEAVTAIGPLFSTGSAKASDLALREAIKSAWDQLIEERRTALLAAQKRIKAELETLACIKIPGGKA